MLERAIYKKRSDIPSNLFPKTRKGYKLTEDAIPVAEYRNSYYKSKSLFYNETDFVKTKAQKVSLVTKEDVAEALYVLNKWAKEHTYLYEIKESVIEKCKELKWVDSEEIHCSKGENRTYVIYSNYDDEDKYHKALKGCKYDEKGRPYISDSEPCYLVFNYYKIGNHGFHSKPERKDCIPKNSILLEDNFIAPRGIVNSEFTLIKAKRIINKFLKGLVNEKVKQ